MCKLPRLRDIAATLIILCILLLDACVFEDPPSPSKTAPVSRYMYRCLAHFACGPDSSSDEYFNACLVGSESDHLWADSENAAWLSTQVEYCMGDHPGCDYPNCFVNCHQIRPSDGCSE